MTQIKENVDAERLYAAALVKPSDRDWPEDSAHENGNYLCNCGACKKTFFGHKRRVRCKQCVTFSSI